MKTFLAIVLLTAAVSAAVTSNGQELVGEPEDNGLDVPDLPEDNELDIPDLPEDDLLDVSDLPKNRCSRMLDGPEEKEVEEDEETGVEFRNNLSLGTFGVNDRIMSRITHSVTAANLLIHDQDITFRGVRGTNITAIRVTQIGSNSPIASRIAGGLGSQFVTIRIRSARSRGFAYTITVYAAINCSNN